MIYTRAEGGYADGQTRVCVILPYIWSVSVSIAWHPSLVAGRRLRLGRSTMRRLSPRRRSSSCCSCSPPTRRPSRRRVASASSQLNRNRSRPQGLVLLRRWPRCAARPAQRRGVLRSPTAASGAAPCVAQGDTRSFRCRFTAPLSPSCTSVGCDGGAGCGETWPTLSHSRTRRTTTTLASRLGSCPRRQVSWRRLARGDETALHHLPPLLRLRVPPVRAVLHCLGGSIKPSVHLHCSRQVGRESSRERWCPRHRTPVACDACATSPTLLASASTGK